MNTRTVLVPARQAAEETGIPYTSIRDLAFRGELAVVKVGRAWYFRRTDLARWIDSRAEVLR